MKYLRALGVVLALLTPVAALDREAFTVTHYDLNLRLEPSQQRLSVRGRITLRNDSAQPQRLADRLLAEFDGLLPGELPLF